MKAVLQVTGWILLVAFGIAVLIWRWNHEGVRVYDFPLIPLPWKW